MGVVFHLFGSLGGVVVGRDDSLEYPRLAFAGSGSSTASLFSCGKEYLPISLCPSYFTRSSSDKTRPSPLIKKGNMMRIFEKKSETRRGIINDDTCVFLQKEFLIAV